MDTNRLRTLNDILLLTGNDYSDVLLDAAAEIERLRDALRQIADKGDDNEYGLHQAMRQMALDALREE